jgi:hypothetical protein
VTDDTVSRERAAADASEELVSRMQMLRSFPVPPTDSDPPTVHDALRELRGRLDLAEVVVAEAARRRRRARRLARLLWAEAEEAYDLALTKLASRAGEYESGKEREASARVKTSPQRRAARAADRIADIAEGADDAIRSAYFGLRDIRKELLATLESYLPWEHSMERS